MVGIDFDLIPVLLLCAMASALGFVCLRRLARVRDFPSWPSAAASVIASGVRLEGHRRANRVEHVHVAGVVYEYSVEGVR